MDKTDLKTEAVKALEKAYSPYSKFKVGAAILTESGNLYAGCNVENVSYGLSICAERTAITRAVTSEGPTMKLREVFVANRNEQGNSIPCSPCGACRQFIAEFAIPATRIHYTGENGDVTTSMSDLLPDGFTF
ncbi:cytidine deaminase [Sneathiella litorea]|uniref:Cytidine deaminase n=1 Tax=Sneathiella litorea TaxID=2606216 RepID=A0A6L8W4D2_9PROT|nr:cytidine deaminase [Sneathiella litorea]MZR29290.1 cytidine deaminase [Sneathiella litorea]